MFLFQEWKKYGKGMAGVGGLLGGCGVMGCGGCLRVWVFGWGSLK